MTIDKKYTDDGLPVVSLESIREFHAFISNTEINEEFQVMMDDLSSKLREENPFLCEYMGRVASHYPDKLSFAGGFLAVYCLLKKEASRGLN
jgi:hypothetical protein